MVAFSFSGRWLPEDKFPTDKERKVEVFRLIQSGEKRTTIRAAKLHRISLQELLELPRVCEGDELQLYWKQRSKNCELIAKATAGRPYQLIIETRVDDRHIILPGGYDYHKLMEGDGFKTKEDFLKFFADGYYWVYPFELK